MILLY